VTGIARPTGSRSYRCLFQARRGVSRFGRKRAHRALRCCRLPTDPKWTLRGLDQDEPPVPFIGREKLSSNHFRNESKFGIFRILLVAVRMAVLEMLACEKLEAAFAASMPTSVFSWVLKSILS